MGTLAARTLPVVIVIIGGLIWYVVSVDSYYDGVAPGQNCTLQTLAGRIQVDDVRRCRRDNETVFIVHGATPPAWIMASGRPAYVFDSQGKFIGWVQDMGESPRQNEFLARGCPGISIEQALAEVAGSR